MAKRKGAGANFERKICKELSLWISGEKSDDLFWRAAMSGGRATSKAKKGETVTECGDISSIGRLGHDLTDLFSVECKSYTDVKMGQLVFKGSGPVLSFWNQTNRDSKYNDKQPMLIFHQIRQPVMMGLSRQGFGIIFGEFKIETPITDFPAFDLVIFPFDRFLKTANPDRLKEFL